MWYVNMIKGLVSVLQGACFILTMWYVNYFLHIAYSIWHPRFILTMWYVNSILFDLAMLGEKVLY